MLSTAKALTTAKMPLLSGHATGDDAASDNANREHVVNCKDFDNNKYAIRGHAMGDDAASNDANSGDTTSDNADIDDYASPL
jgi:hypothetical protein